MLNLLPDLGEWPTLDWEQWKDTAETLHMCMQVVGKTRLALMPLQNHWWNTTFHVTARGLTASELATRRAAEDYVARKRGRVSGGPTRATTGVDARPSGLWLDAGAGRG